MALLSASGPGASALLGSPFSFLFLCSDEQYIAQDVAHHDVKHFATLPNYLGCFLNMHKHYARATVACALCRRWKHCGGRGGASELHMTS